MSYQLRKAALAILGTAALAGVSTQSRAVNAPSLGTLTADNTVLTRTTNGAVHGWDGGNNGYLGWTHHTKWQTFTLDIPMSVEVKVAAVCGPTGELCVPDPVSGTQYQNTFLPAFTIWATSSSGFNGANHLPNYSYKRVLDGYATPTHPYNQVRGAPDNLIGQLDPSTGEEWNPASKGDCPAGDYCNANNWLAPGGGDGSYGTKDIDPTTDGITTLVGYANSGPTGWTNGNGDVVGSGGIGSDSNGPLSGEFFVQGPDWSDPKLGDQAPSKTIQFASLKLYNLAAGTYLMAPGGSCAGDAACDLVDGFDSLETYRITVTKIAAPVPLPAAVWLFASALAGMGALARRRDRARG